MGNLLVDTGRAIITNRLKGSGTEPSYLAWGTGAGTTAHGDTTLFTEDSAGSPAYARIAATTTQQTTSTTNDTWRAIATITANAGKTITNFGLFDALTTGNLFVKGDHTGIPLSTSDSIQYTVSISFS